MLKNERTTAVKENSNATNTNNHQLWSNFLVNLATNRVVNLRKNLATEIQQQQNVDSQGDHHHGRSSSSPQLSLASDDHVDNDNDDDPDDRNFTGYKTNGAGCPRQLKLWGNFVDLYDRDGRQRMFIRLDQLSNYMPLENRAEPDSPYRIYASLFHGNYPKPLCFGSGTRWRMRYNIFSSGVSDPGTGNSDIATTSDSETVLHIGEILLYFNVEPGKPTPMYQNLCFFYDQCLNQLLDRKPTAVGATIEQQRELLMECTEHIRNELSLGRFTEQLFFPVERERFAVIDENVDYFTLRQIDLSVAIYLANVTNGEGGGLGRFLHRAKIVTTDGAGGGGGGAVGTVEAIDRQEKHPDGGGGDNLH